MVVSPSTNRARLRSISPLPITANPRKLRPTVQRPVRSNPATIPTALIEAGAAPGTGCAVDGRNSRMLAASSASVWAA